MPDTPTKATPPPPPVVVPGPIQVAMSFMSYVEKVTVSRLVQGPDGPHVEPGRELDLLEGRTRDAALELLRGYLACAGKWIGTHEEKLDSETPPPAGPPES